VSGPLAGVSVCVPAYNEQRHIGALLASLDAQTLAPEEVIVADCGSRDRTAQIAAAMGARVLRLGRRGPGAARNAAAGVAQGEVLAFVDADVACAPSYLERLVAPIAEGLAAGTFTGDMYLANPHNRWARAYAAIQWMAPGRVLPPDLPERWNVFHAIRRDRFLAVGGYDDVGYGEDRSLAPKLGGLALIAPGAVCFHHNPETAREIFENGRWVGRGAAIRTLERPWMAHAPLRVLGIAIAQIRHGRTPWVLPARLIYHAGVWLGLAGSSIRPARHWK
jgi:glycosyltransferase involved in cell wall biosynthesis